MTNEELAVQAQDGDHEALLALWGQVQRLVWVQARRWAGYGGTTMEDLLQAGVVALLRAVGSYDPQKGKFSTWLFPLLRAEFAIATGQHRKRTRLDPLQEAVSLETPLTDDDEDGTLGDLIPDSAAEVAFLAVEHDELHDALEAALATLGPEEQRTIRTRYFQGMTVAEIAAAEGVSRNVVSNRERKSLLRLRHPMRSRRLEAFL